MRTNLLPFQIEGVRKIHKFKGRALLADQQGLGKTLVVISWFQANPDVRPIVVVCPAMVKWWWESEILMQTGIQCHIIEGRKPTKRIPITSPQIVIINYDILENHLEYIKSLKPKLIVGDEVQMVKARGAKRTKAFRKLCQNVDHVIAASGTPIEIRPIELFVILNILRPDVFPSFHSYAHRFCNPRRRPWGWEFKGATNLPELHMLLRENCMIRHRKKDVLKDLPDKTRMVITVDVDPVGMAEYKEAENNFKMWLMKQRMSRGAKFRALKAEAIVQMGYLKRLAAKIKMKSVFNWIDNFLETTQDKIILFSIHKHIMSMIVDRYKDICVTIDGSVTNQKRKLAVTQFNNSKHKRIMNGQIVAAGLGWSATSTNTTVFVELDWIPAKHNQAEDRTHGLSRGVEGKKSFSFYIVAKDTIEVMLCKLLTQRQKVLDSVLDGGSPSNFDLISTLLEEMKIGKK